LTTESNIKIITIPVVHVEGHLLPLLTWPPDHSFLGRTDIQLMKKFKYRLVSVLCGGSMSNLCLNKEDEWSNAKSDYGNE
jgi:hypothetical protein